MCDSKEIHEALSEFKNASLYEGSIKLLNSLRFESERTQKKEGTLNSFIEQFALQEIWTEKETAFMKKSVKKLHFLFQVTPEDSTDLIASSRKGMIAKSLYFISTELNSNSPLNFEIAGITRILNKTFPSPTLCIMRYDNTNLVFNKMALATNYRTTNKHDPEKDVIRGAKYIRDINLKDFRCANAKMLSKWREPFSEPKTAFGDLIFKLSRFRYNNGKQIYRLSKRTYSPLCINLLFDELRVYPIRLSSEEEKFLTREVVNKTFDWTKRNKMRNKMICSNIRLAIKIAEKTYRSRIIEEYPDIDLLDLIQEGIFGLFRSLESFDPNKENKFSTYASWWIRARIERYIKKNKNIVSVPIYMLEKVEEAKKIKEKIFSKNEKYPSIQDMANELNETIEKTTIILNASEISTVSLEDEHLENEIEETEIEQFKIVQKKQSIRLVQSMLNRLGNRDRQIIKLRFGIGKEDKKTLEEIGKLLGLTRERIRQIESRILKELKRMTSKYNLKEAL